MSLDLGMDKLYTFGIRTAFFAAYSHNFPIFRSFGPSSCHKSQAVMSDKQEGSEMSHSVDKGSKRYEMRSTNLITREDISNELLVPLHRLSRSCTQRRAKNAKATTNRQNLPRDYTRDCAHSSNPDSSPKTPLIIMRIPLKSLKLLSPPSWSTEKALELPRSRRKTEFDD